MNRVLLALTLSFATLFLFQNCAGGVLKSHSIKLTCTPKEKPCLNYYFAMKKKDSNGSAMDVQFKGTPNEGVSDNSTFSSNCLKTGNSTAQCGMDMEATATIQSNLQNGDGRILQIAFYTDSLVEGVADGTLMAKATNLQMMADKTQVAEAALVPLAEAEVKGEPVEQGGASEQASEAESQAELESLGPESGAFYGVCLRSPPNRVYFSGQIIQLSDLVPCE